jgi:hypothetical protein
LCAERRSHLITLSAAELPLPAKSAPISAAAIPEVLLSEDQELPPAAIEHGRWFAVVEHQLSWDVYRVRVAPRATELCNDERSYAIYLSGAQMQADMGLPPEPAVPEQLPVLPADLVVSEQQGRTAGGDSPRACISSAIRSAALLASMGHPALGCSLSTARCGTLLTRSRV